MKKFLVLMLLAPALAGCIQGDDEAPAVSTFGRASSDPAVAELEFLEDDLLVTIPIDVVLIGFPEQTVSSLERILDQDEELRHIALDYSRALPFSPQEKALGGDGSIRWPWTLRADYQLHPATEELTQEFLAEMSNQLVEGTETVYDGNHALDWLTAKLPEHGLDLDSNRPALVVVHTGDALAEGHSYRFTGDDGYLQPVRYLETTQPVVMFDVSAIADPYAGTSKSYHAPTTVTDTRAVHDLVRDVTHFRLLHGPIYPIATKDCHAVTLILAVRGSSTTAVLPGFTKPEDAVDLEAMESNFEHLTNADNVFVDYNILYLPQDDPALDAITRESNDLDAFRYWLEENWENYWVSHEGCEPYVSFALYGDSADEGLSFSGIAMYDVGQGHRISFSIVSDTTRLGSEWGNQTGQENVDDFMDTSSEGRATNHWFNRLFSHETGHLFGQAHPHNAIEVGGQNYAGFSSVLDTMSYQVRGVTDDFGSIATNNFLRNRAGFYLGEAYDLGHGGSAEYQQALDLVEQFKWQEAGDVLLPVINS